MTAVSVLIPAHNAERWIAQAVESALAQCVGAAEVIVVDDGSSDDTLARLTPFCERIRLESGPNRGAPAARNRLLELASSAWVQYLDADDYLMPYKVAGQLALIAEDAEVDVLYGPATIEWYRAGGTELLIAEIPAPHDPWSELARWQLPQTGAPLFRRQALLDVGGWREDQPCCQEHELYLRLLVARKRFRYADAGGAVYRRFESGTLSTRDMALVRRERIRIEDRLETYLREHAMLTPERQWAINQARFETARSTWPEDRATARDIHAGIRRSGADFSPGGIAAPRLYRAIYAIGGFAAAERVAGLARAMRGGLA